MRSARLFLLAALFIAFACASAPPPPPPPPQPVAPPPPDPTTFKAVVSFDAGSASLDDEGIHKLDDFARKLEPFPNHSLHVEGYSDMSAADRADEWLPERRAKTVASYLVALGMPIERITVQGRAAASPDDTGADSGRRVAEVSVR